VQRVAQKAPRQAVRRARPPKAMSIVKLLIHDATATPPGLASGTGAGPVTQSVPQAFLPVWRPILTQIALLSIRKCARHRPASAPPPEPALIQGTRAGIPGLSQFCGRHAKRTRSQDSAEEISVQRTRIVESPIDEAGLKAELEAIAAAHGGNTPAARKAVLELLKEVLANGRSLIRARLEEDGKGLKCARRLSALTDTIIRGLFDFATSHVFPASNPSAAERLSLAAVGGYGRGTLAPHSDIDLLFLFPWKQTAWSESVTEYILYMLWDLRLKVGHATRTVNETLKAARDDMTIRTALLESRLLAGDVELFEELETRFKSEVVAGTARQFIAAKLAERDSRHARAGQSRYLVEPQVKEGKGGQRDLQTLFWIAKYYYQVSSNEALVDAGLLSRKEYALFRRCADFLWAVRCHLHFLTGRAEERLSFDLQAELAPRLGYQKHPGLRAAERFMKHYFLVAKDVGDLTRIVCAELEEREAKKAPRLNRLLRGMRSPGRKAKASGNFIVEHGRINVAADDVFERDPVNFIRIFHEAGRNDYAFHPDALRLITKSLKRVDRKLQQDPEANRLFLEVLCEPDHAESVLRHMNEAGVLGRFIPDFGKIVAMMQFNMYHHYTVDEHLIRAIGVLSALRTGRITGDHPLSGEILPSIKDMTALTVALFLHDIAKGRPEDHSIAGAKVARRLCPRLGLTPDQTELVVWLVEEHLTMSRVAQSRDLSDRRTILDFSQVVRTLERMKLLLVLTVCDIRAVGPGVWNGWKGQLLRALYYETEPILTGAFSAESHSRQIAEARNALAAQLADWPETERESYLDLHYPAYWLRVDEERQVRHAALVRKADREQLRFAYEVRPMAFEGATELTILAPDHPRLLAAIAGACATCEANIVDAQIFTTADGRALDTVIISRAFDQDADEERRGARIAELIEQGLEGRVALAETLAGKRKKSRRREAFKIEPQVTLNNELSDRFTVVEVECLDRHGLLYDLTRGISELSLDIASAHIATFGERAVDTFYVTDLVGHKVTAKTRQSRIRNALIKAIGDSASETAAKEPALT
jgi:[protein-PII] uridylyltransferase